MGKFSTYSTESGGFATIIMLLGAAGMLAFNSTSIYMSIAGLLISVYALFITINS